MIDFTWGTFYFSTKYKKVLEHVLNATIKSNEQKIDPGVHINEKYLKPVSYYHFGVKADLVWNSKRLISFHVIVQ